MEPVLIGGFSFGQLHPNNLAASRLEIIDLFKVIFS